MLSAKLMIIVVMAVSLVLFRMSRTKLWSILIWSNGKQKWGNSFSLILECCNRGLISCYINAIHS